MYITLLTISLAAAALAAPTFPKPGPVYYPKTFVDTFDNAKGEAAGAVPELALVDGTAGGALAYRGWAYTQGAATQATLKNPSGTVGIVTGLVTMEEEGQPQWYPMNSSIPYFDQKQISYACVANTQALVAVPTSCTIQVTGTHAVDGTTVVMELLYNPTGVVGQSFATATFPATWTKLSAVDTQVVQSTLGTTLTAPIFDNNVYVAYEQKW